MQVPDWNASERGKQRRKNANGRLLHCCCICGKLEPWNRQWVYYGSIEEEENGVPLPKFCSAACSRLGGEDASAVTMEMRQAARDAEWREPTIVYREATDREKYQIAAQEQRARHPGRQQ